MATTFTIDLTTLPALLAVLGPGRQLGLFTVDGNAWTAAIVGPVGFAPPQPSPDPQTAFTAAVGALGAQAAASAKAATATATAIAAVAATAIPIQPGQPDQPANIAIQGTP